MTRGWWWIAAAWLVIGASAAGQAPAPARDNLWSLPDQAVGYVTFDPGPLGSSDRTPAVVCAAVRGLLHNVVSIEGGSSVADSLLRARVLGRSPWRVCLLEIQGPTVELKGPRRELIRHVRPEKFAAVLEIRVPQADGSHDELVAAIEGGLARDSKDDGSPRTRAGVTLSGGLKGTASTSGSSWRDVVWVSRPDAFLVGFGKGALDAWLTMTPRRGSWLDHRMAIGKKRGRMQPVFEAFVDLGALRRGVPDEFAGGRLDRLVHAWQVPNDRTLMLSAALVTGPKRDSSKEEVAEVRERLLALDLSWTSRAEKPGQIHITSISEGQWPEGMKPREGEGWALLVRSGVPSWIGIGLDTYAALGPQEFGVVRDRWERRTAAVLERLAPRVGEWTVVRPGPELVIELRPAEGPDRMAADLRALFSTMAPMVTMVGRGWGLEAAAEDELRGLAWRVEGSAVVTEWREKK